jgi:hypothetical protein
MLPVLRIDTHGSTSSRKAVMIGRGGSKESKCVYLQESRYSMWKFRVERRGNA